jgi:hypothetical protein
VGVKSLTRSCYYCMQPTVLIFRIRTYWLNGLFIFQLISWNIKKLVVIVSENKGAWFGFFALFSCLGYAKGLHCIIFASVFLMQIEGKEPTFADHLLYADNWATYKWYIIQSSHHCGEITYSLYFSYHKSEGQRCRMA